MSTRNRTRTRTRTNNGILSSTRRRQVAHAIRYEHATWKFLEERFGVTRGMLQKELRQGYPVKKELYRELLRMARSNESYGQEDPSTPASKEVTVLETGYLMEVGPQGLQKLCSTEVPLVLPRFCVNELNKLATRFTVAQEVVDLLERVIPSRITLVEIRPKDEILYEEPLEEMRARTLGVVAVAVDLDYHGNKVNILTNSGEILKLVRIQGDTDISVTLVK